MIQKMRDFKMKILIKNYKIEIYKILIKILESIMKKITHQCNLMKVILTMKIDKDLEAILK